MDCLVDWVAAKLDYLVTARPTAVNMATARDNLKHFIKLKKQSDVSAEKMKSSLINEIEGMLVKDISDNKAIGSNGAEHMTRNIKAEKIVALTHCNTGSLATAGYGTALGVVRALHEKGALGHTYCTETRPYNQGSRLTAYELVHDHIPATLIADSMVSIALKEKRVSVIVVGADRVAANGDTANKIGTYQLAISGKDKISDFNLISQLHREKRFCSVTLQNTAIVCIYKMALTGPLGRSVLIELIELSSINKVSLV